ncbi:hypothetical protein Trydic_g20662 [Trypoxylus dichotomus]
MHASNLYKDYLQHIEVERSIKVMEWPPQSPDINSIEFLREELDRGVRKAVLSSEADLWKKLQEAWVWITSATLTKLFARVLYAIVIKSKRGHIYERQV